MHPTTLPAYEMQIDDPQLRIYMQTEVLAGGVRSDCFGQSVAAFRRSFKERPPAVCADGCLGRIVDLDETEGRSDAGLQRAAESLLEQLSFDAMGTEALFRDFAWKVRILPDNIADILSVGCGDGAELVFLRSRFPGAKIIALDYVNKISGQQRTLDLLQAEFLQGDIFESIGGLHSHGLRFDLIFSNHVIEHFYEPDQQIASLCQLLRKGGMFSAGLPLDAYPFADWLAKIGKAPTLAHALDMNWLDLRHPWKTHEADLAATLRRAGLVDVQVYRRRNHANNAKSGIQLSLTECREREHRARRAYAFTLKPLVDALKMLFGQNPPRRLVRLVFAVERRLPFGRYRVKCDVQPEVFVTAIREAN